VFVRHVTNVGDAVVQTVDLGLIQIDARHRKPRMGEFDGERQSYITEANDPDFRCLFGEFALE
jgi:hypothetical protein